MLTMAPPRPRDEPPDLGPPPAPGRFTEAFSIVPGKMAEGGTTAGRQHRTGDDRGGGRSGLHYRRADSGCGGQHHRER